MADAILVENHDHDGDDNEEEEEDFVPGADDDDELDDYDDDDDDDEQHNGDELVPLLHGTLFLNADMRLCFAGNGFRFTSTSSEPVPSHLFLNELASSEKNRLASATMYSFEMEGNFDIGPDRETISTPDSRSAKSVANSAAHESLNQKMRLMVTWSKIQDIVSKDAKGMLDDAKGVVSNLKRSDEDYDDDENEDGKKNSLATPSQVAYQIYAKQISSAEESARQKLWLEFNGLYRDTDRSSDPHENAVTLTCQYRFVGLSSTTNLASSTGVAAAAASNNGKVDGEDDDEDDNDNEDYGDEDVDYDELIALHEDAGLPVETIRKRYWANDDDNVDGEEPNEKPQKRKPTSRQKVSDDDDDDEDIGF